MILSFILIHIIGVVVTIFIHFYNGTFKYSSKHGDGIRFARPFDVIWFDLFLWELQFLIFILESIENFTNNIFTEIFR